MSETTQPSVRDIPIQTSDFSFHRSVFHSPRDENLPCRVWLSLSVTNWAAVESRFISSVRRWVVNLFGSSMFRLLTMSARYISEELYWRESRLIVSRVNWVREGKNIEKRKNTEQHAYIRPGWKRALPLDNVSLRSSTPLHMILIDLW